MKHTFSFIDMLMISIKYLPKRDISTPEKKAKATKAIQLIREYSQILDKLLTSHRSKVYLDRLHKSHVGQVENWVTHVETTFEKIKALLSALNKDVDALAHVLEHEHEGEENVKWQSTVAEMSLGMFLSGLRDEKDAMVKLKGVAVFEMDELEAIITHKGHMEGMQAWQQLSGLPEAEQILAQERYFTELMS